MSDRAYPSPHPRGFPAALVTMAVGLTTNSVLGPLGFDVIDYPISGTLLNQVVGLEVVTLCLVVPMTVLAAVLSVRGRPGAALLGLGPAGYSAYMLVQYVLGPEYAAYTGIAFFHVGLFTLAAVVGAWAWARSALERLPQRSTRQLKLHGVLLLALALFILSRYAGAVLGGRLPAEFAEAHTFYWSIFLLDLGIVVPVTAATGIGLLRGNRVAQRASYAVVLWFALVPPSVAAMSITMLVNDDPYASLGQVIMLSSFALLFAALAGWICRPLLRPEGPGVEGPVGVGSLASAGRSGNTGV